MALEGGEAETLADLSVYSQGKRFVDLYNTGKGEIHWSAKPSEPWIKLDLGSGAFTTEQRIWINIDWDHVPNGYDSEATVMVTSDAGNQKFIVPVFKPAGPSPKDITGFVESHGHVSMEAEHFTRKESRGGAAWEIIKGLGRSGDTVAVFPPTVASRTRPDEIRSDSPSLQYDIHTFHAGEARLDIDCLPTKAVAPGTGVRVAVGIDGQEPKILNGPGGDVLANLRRLTAKVEIDEPGKHVLTLWMVDPGVVIDKMVLDFGKARESYLGPPESFRGGSLKN